MHWWRWLPASCKSVSDHQSKFVKIMKRLNRLERILVVIINFAIDCGLAVKQLEFVRLCYHTKPLEVITLMSPMGEIYKRKHQHLDDGSCSLVCVYSIHYRFLWSLLFISAFGLFMYLVANKIMLLASYPKNVNVDIDYQSSLPFPAVTMCNLNPYR